MLRKAKYAGRALLGTLRLDYSCPSCESLETFAIQRKAVVTSLRECRDCGLRFRYPKERETSSIRFYQKEYQAGFTTDLPTDDELDRLIGQGFQATPKDFSAYVSILRAVGLQPGDTILDFGASWGYGSWQLRQAGFKVYSYEISRPRAQYAAEKLGCQVIKDVGELPQRVRCFFSTHVLEHLHDPNILWKTAVASLVRDGLIICTVPNGEPEVEQILGSRQYHQLWGQPHPLLLTRRALEFMAQRYGFNSHLFSPPYDLEDIESRHSTTRLLGHEILMVASRD